MTEEQAIQAQFMGKFDFLRDKVRIQRPRRVFIDAPAERIGEVFDFAIKQAGCVILCSLTGLDLGATLGVVYHLARESGVMVNVSTAVPKDKPVLKTVTPYFPAADAYERELVDLLGFQVEGLAPGSRYPLPDDWPAGQYPLRKDWKVEMLEGKLTPKEADHA